MLTAVNGLAVLVGAIVFMAIGMAWYSPRLFGKPWMKLRGKDPAEMRHMKFPVREMIVQFITSLVTAFLIAEFCRWLGVIDIVGGLLLGFWLWVGFYATTLLDSLLWDKTPFQLYVINASQRLVSLLAVSALLGMWH